MEEQFAACNLNVVELPIEWIDGVICYRGFIRELPFLTGEGQSKAQMYRQLLEAYQEYLESHHIAEEKTEKMTSSLLSVEDLLKYYDGETFDGFAYDFSNQSVDSD